MRWGRYIALLASVFALCTAAAPADAGTYHVFACGDAPGATNNSWDAHNNDVGPGQLETGNGCGGSGGYAGLFSRDALTCGSSCSPIPNGAFAGWTFAAPAGTSITALSYSRWMSKSSDDDWRPALTADGTVVTGEACSLGAPDFSCEVGVQGGSRVQLTLPVVSALDLGVYCTPNSAGNCYGGVTLHEVAAVLYAATVTLSDSSVPSLTNLGGPLLAGGYIKGSQAAAFDATDNSGIQSARLYVDGSPQPSTSYSCDFTYAVPCSNQNGSQLTLDTRALSDGTHNIQVAASDAAANEQKSAAQTITVDNTAPTAPQDLTVEGGDGWHASNSFSVDWTNPSEQVAPIDAVHYEVCAPDGSSCGPEQELAGGDVSHLDGVSVPSPGEWTLHLWLEDGAGNTDLGQAATATLRYGTGPEQAPAAGGSDSPSGAGGTTDSSASSGSAAPTEPSAPVTSPLASFTAPLRQPGLRATSARFHHGALLLRGRVNPQAAGLVSLKLRVRGRVVTVKRRIRGGAFRLRARVAAKPRRATLYFAPRARFAAQSVRIRIG